MTLSRRKSKRIRIPTLVLYEWLRGPRKPQELAAQEALLPRETAVPFGPTEAALAATLYSKLPRPRGREIDLAIAACTLTHDARLWTLNVDEFIDVPGLDVVTTFLRHLKKRTGTGVEWPH